MSIFLLPLNELFEFCEDLKAKNELIQTMHLVVIEKSVISSEGRTKFQLKVFLPSQSQGKVRHPANDPKASHAFQNFQMRFSPS